MKTLKDISREEITPTVVNKRRAWFIVSYKNDPGLFTYDNIVLSPSGKYCNAGMCHWWNTAWGYSQWVPVEDITIIEQFE